jgi:hypothetical protein
MPDAIDRLARPAAARRLAGAAAMLLLGLTATGAAAQGPAEFQLAQASQKQGAPPRQAQPAQPPANPIDKQIAELQKRLAITDAQKPQFDAFTQIVRQNAQTIDQLVQQEQKAAHNAVDDLRSSVKIAQEEADGLKRLLPAMEALYASLSDQQKRTADQLLGGQQNQPPPQQQQQQPRPKQG